MIEYTKINTIWKRDERGNIIVGEYATPEIEYLAGNKWLFTEKVDGTNTRVMFDGQQVRFGGRTKDSAIDNRLLHRLQDLFPAEKMKAVFPEGGCLYGEGYGAMIQAAGKLYNPNGQDFVLFDVRVGDYWLRFKDVADVAKRLGINHVPLGGCGDLNMMMKRVQDGEMSAWGPFKAEGIVARPEVDLFDRKGERILVKLKTKDFTPRGQRVAVR